MNGAEGADDPRGFEPRPDFLGRLREAVRLQAGSSSDVVPWSAGRTESGPELEPEPAADYARPLPAIRGIEIHHEIGRGGMGTVYRARQIGLNRLIALKLVWLGRADSAENAITLAKGPRAIASLSHPHIIQIFQIGKQDGWAYGVFEYLEGGDLREALRRNGPRPPEQAAALVRTLAETVWFIHQRGLVHCDLKCSNVLLSADGVPKIADFGLVKLLEDGDAVLQNSGIVAGTPRSMAPEQAAGTTSAIGPPVDVHALGIILYELLTGRPPFLGATREETLRQIVEKIPDPPSRFRPDAPRALDEVCRRCLQKDPIRRYSDARALADDLSEYLDRGAPTRDELEAALGEAEQALHLCRLALAERELARGRPEEARAILSACAPRRRRPDRRDSRWHEIWNRCRAGDSGAS